MKRMIAYCGLVCSACDWLPGNPGKRHEWLERLAAHARSAYNAPETTSSTSCATAARRRARACVLTAPVRFTCLRIGAQCGNLRRL
jgi:predicted small metal-binding protein